MRIITYKTMLHQDTNHNILVKDKSVNYPKVDKMDSPEKIVDVMNNVFNMNSFAEEYVYLVALNSKCAPLGVFEISHGTVNSSLINPREVLIKILLCGGVNSVLVHNHVSGISDPSTEDIRVTKRVKEACELIGINLIDHLIIGNNEYFSFKEKNMI